MAAITSSTSSIQTAQLTPSAQMQQLWQTLFMLAGSVCESTDVAFKRVHLMKKDANGCIKLYDKKEMVTDLATGLQKEVIKREAQLTYIEDMKTGEIYADEPHYVVAVKCALIALILPTYTLGKIGWYGVATLLSVCAIALETIAHIGKQLSLGERHEAGKIGRRGYAQCVQVLENGLFEMGKALPFGLGCEVAAIYGIFKPYHGRKYEALIENAWQRGLSYKQDMRKIPARPNEDCLTACIKDTHAAQVIYVGHCFQVRGNTREPRVVVIRRE